jgi:hypothetical protein
MDELLRSALGAEAETVVPRGDGLARIQQRVAARRSRRLWLAPVAALASLLVVGGAAFAAYSVTHQPSHDTQQILPAESQSPTPDATPTPSPAATATQQPVVTFPGFAFYPFTSPQQELSWERASGPAAQPWFLDATATAQHFVTDFVGETSTATVVSRALGTEQATVTLGRPAPEGSGTLPVTVVHLQKFQRAWLVTAADDARGQLSVSTPAGGATLHSPVTVTGPAFGVDEAARVDIRTTDGVVAIGSTGSFGSGSRSWSARLSWPAASAPRGAVVVTEASAADGLPARIVAVPVSFDAAVVQPYPAYFYGIKDGRVTEYSARDGATVRYLTAAEPGGGASDPQRDGDTVYYLAGSGTCANALMSIPATGGSATQTAASPSGYVITGYGVHGRSIALYETACASGTSPQAQLVLTTPIDDTNTRTSTIAYDAPPPGVVGDPAWQPDGAHVDVVLRTGNEAEVRAYAFDATDPNSGSTPCSHTPDGLPQALTTTADGTVLVAAQTGAGTRVSRCSAGTVTTLFTVAGAQTPHDLSVTQDASAVLLTDSNGGVWRWDAASGHATQLHPKVPQPDVSW